MINQSTNPSFRGTAADPNNGQSVSVVAQTTYDHLAFDGNAYVTLSRTSLLPGYGTGGVKNGVGAAVRANIMNNTTLAQIDSGATIHIGSAGTLEVESNQFIVDVSVVMAGTSAGNIGFTGTGAWNDITSSTIAQIQDGVTVNGGGAVSVLANDDVVLGNLAGGVLSGQASGFGFTVAGNTLNRTTIAQIGGASHPPVTDNFQVGSITVQANSTGNVAAVTLAAAVAVGSNPLPGVTPTP